MLSENEIKERLPVTRYCEIGKHQVSQTIRCQTCLRFFCSRHVSHNCKQQGLGSALWHLTTAITYRLLTRPIERLAQRIRYGKWAREKATTDPQPTPVQPTQHDKPRKLIPCPHGFNNYMNCKICKDYNFYKGAEV